MTICKGKYDQVVMEMSGAHMFGFNAYWKTHDNCGTKGHNGNAKNHIQRCVVTPGKKECIIAHRQVRNSTTELHPLPSNVLSQFQGS